MCKKRIFEGAEKIGTGGFNNNAGIYLYCSAYCNFAWEFLNLFSLLLDGLPLVASKPLCTNVRMALCIIYICACIIYHYTPPPQFTLLECK